MTRSLNATKGTDSMLALDREKLAWAAGFFDGEGHCRSGFNANGKKSGTVKYRRVQMVVRQIHPEVLEMFQESVGGIGSILGPWTPAYRPNSNPLWSWSTNGYQTVQAVGAMLWPFLGSVKRAQISDALVRWRTGPIKEMKPSLMH